MPSNRRIIPLTGSDAFRLLCESLGLILDNEIHTTDDHKRVFYDGTHVAPVWHGEVAGAAEMLALRTSSDRSVFPMDTCLRADTGTVWLCITNRGQTVDDWFNIGAGSDISEVDELDGGDENDIEDILDGGDEDPLDDTTDGNYTDFNPFIAAAPKEGTYIVKTPTPDLPNAIALSELGDSSLLDGLLFVEEDGSVRLAIPGTDYLDPSVADNFITIPLGLPGVPQGSILVYDNAIPGWRAVAASVGTTPLFYNGHVLRRTSAGYGVVWDRQDVFLFSVSPDITTQVTTGETSLYTQDLTGMMLVAGNSVLWEGKIITAANANNKRIKVKYDGTTVYDTTAITLNDKDITLRVRVVLKTGSTTVWVLIEVISNDATLGSLSVNTGVASNGDKILDITAQGGATDDIQLLYRRLTVEA